MNVKRVSISANTIIRLIAVAAIVISAMVVFGRLSNRVGGVTPVIAADAVSTSVPAQLPASTLTYEQCDRLTKAETMFQYTVGKCYVWRNSGWQEVSK